MSRARRTRWLVAFWLFAGACERPREEAPEPSSPQEAPPPGEAGAVCLQGEPFVADGPVGLPAPGPEGALRVDALRWEAHDGCERFVIDVIGADDAPAASPGSVAAEVLRDLGVVRVSLREAQEVAPEATEAVFDGPLAGAAYAIRSAEGGWIDVDLHLSEAAEAHVHVLERPARVVVDLRPGGGAVPVPPVATLRVVILRPRPGAATYPLTVTGYARTFEANVVARLEQEGRELLETFTTATAWVDAWGAFSITIEEGPPGVVELHVGEYSARDGTWEGARIAIEMR